MSVLKWESHTKPLSKWELRFVLPKVILAWERCTPGLGPISKKDVKSGVAHESGATLADVFNTGIMIKGFNKNTYPTMVETWRTIKKDDDLKRLIWEERRTKIKAKLIKEKIGKSPSKKAGKLPSELSKTRLIAMFKYIRMHNLVPNLVASEEGYWRTTSPTEMRDFITSCEQRARAFLYTATAMEDQLETMRSTINQKQ